MERVSRDVVARLVIGAATPPIAAVVFGLVQSLRPRTGPQNWYDTYAMLSGGVISLFCLWAYSRLLSTESRRGGLAAAFLEMSRLPALGFAIYLLGVAGAFRLFLLFGGGFSWFRLCAGSLWVILGYIMLYRLWVFSELIEAVHDRRLIVSDDSASIGVRGDVNAR